MTDDLTASVESPIPPQRKHNFAGRLAILIAISVIYVGFVGSVFLGFSGYILRVNLERDLSNDGGIDKLLFSITEVATLENELEKASDDIATKQLEIVDKKAETSKLEGEFWATNSARNAVFMPVGLMMGRNREIFDPNYIDKFGNYLEESNDNLESSTYLTAMIASPVFLDSADPEKKDEIFQSFIGIFKEITELNNKLEHTSILDDISKGQIAQLEEQLIELHEYQASVFARLTELRTSDVYANKSRVLSFEPLLWGGVYKLIQVPTIILTLIVTIAAGGLGSVVSFTRGLLIEGDGASIQQLFVSVGEGIAAAVAIFFLAGAGMLMFSTGGSNGSAEISPYMVAFLAFVSGFMAEDAFKNIQRAGQKIFTGGDGKKEPEKA